MPQHLKTSQRDLSEQVAGVQRIGRGIEPHVGRHLGTDASLRQRLAIGGVVDEATRRELGNDIAELRHVYRVERATRHVRYCDESCSSTAKAARTHSGTGTTFGAPGVVDT